MSYITRELHFDLNYYASILTPRLASQSQDGTGKSTNTEGERGREDSWDRDEVYAVSGYTEYIEVEFETSLYISAVDIGEVRGCGSIVHVYAKNSETNLSLAMYKDKPDTSCDAPEGRARLTKVASTFSPPKLCHTPFLANRVRVELDTRAVPDWNELDYVRVTGYERPPIGVLPFGISQVEYSPNPNYFGYDKFSFLATDCGYQTDSWSEVAEFLVRIEGTPDALQLKRIEIEVESRGNETSNKINFSGMVNNLDQSELHLRFPEVPAIGVLLHASKKVAPSDNFELDAVFEFDVSSLVLDEDVLVEFKYEVEDVRNGFVSTNYVEITIIAGDVGVVGGFGLSETDIMFLVGSIALAGGMLTIMNMAIKRRLKVRD